MQNEAETKKATRQAELKKQLNKATSRAELKQKQQHKKKQEKEKEKGSGNWKMAQMSVPYWRWTCWKARQGFHTKGKAKAKAKAAAEAEAWQGGEASKAEWKQLENRREMGYQQINECLGLLHMFMQIRRRKCYKQLAKPMTLIRIWAKEVWK